MGFRYPTFLEYLKHEYAGPFMATDILIRYFDGKKDGIVLIERKFEPLGLAIPGGMAENMTFTQNCTKESKEETGLDVTIDTPNRPLCEFSDPSGDPRASIATVVYTAQGKGELKPHKDEDAKNARVFSLDELADLLDSGVWAFPKRHPKIIALYLEDNLDKLSVDYQKKVLNYMQKVGLK